MKNVITILMLMLMACNKKDVDNRAPQGALLLAEGFEMAPIDFMGENLLLVFEREPRPTDTRQRKVVFYDRYTMEEHSSFDYDLAFSSALVHNGELLIFGATKNGRQIKYYSTADLVNFTDRGVVFEVAADDHLYNTSVIHDGTQFVMAYETIKPVVFSSHIATTTDLDNDFETLGDALRPERYTACPLIRKEGIYYYVLYLSAEYTNGFELVTRISRSTDLINWERGGIVFRPGFQDGFNFSDVDVIEDADGNLEVYYMNGDQSTWMNLETLLFEGSFADMWDEST